MATTKKDRSYLRLDDHSVTKDAMGNDITQLDLLNLGGFLLISKGKNTGKYYYHTPDDVALIYGPYDSLVEATQEDLRYKED